MKLSLFEVYRYTLPSRNGIFVRLRNEIGQEGVGEVAPLPGRSKETLEEALTALNDIKLRLFSKNLTSTTYPPSVLFGMEMAMLSLLSPLKEERLFSLIYRTPTHKECKLKRSEITVDLCKRLIDEGFRIRLDFQCKPDPEFLSHFTPNDFLYIEDPVARTEDLRPFYERTGFSIALDELDAPSDTPGVTHRIVKPSLYGGLSYCKTLHERYPNQTIVYSSLNETAIGLHHIARIALETNPNQPIGIDTDPLLPLFKPRSCSLPPALLQPDWSSLQKLPC